MWAVLVFIQKHLVWTIPGAMVLGVLYGYFYDPMPLKSAIVPATFVMVYPMMVNLRLRAVLSHGDAKLQIVTQLLNFAVLPFLALGIGKLFFADEPLIALGMLLASLLPTSGMTISWTGFAHGNVHSAVKMTVIGLIAGSLATPLYIGWLMGAVVEIPVSKVFQQIFLLVFLPMILGQITQWILVRKYGSIHYDRHLKKRFPLFSTIGVLAIIFIAMSLKGEMIVSQPAKLAALLIPLGLLYGLNFLISTVVGKVFFNRGDAIALVYGTVMRNLSIALAIAMTAFGTEGSEIAMIIAVAFIIQAQSAAWYVRFTDRIFGKVEAHLK